MSRLSSRKVYGFDWRRMRNPNGTARKGCFKRRVLPLRIGGPASAEVGRRPTSLRETAGGASVSPPPNSRSVPVVIAGRPVVVATG
ncbi:unnamed protein product [Lasius platythorax]|uniref:Uncharacterized protein n=1 Tax=Lasius platythorax TaxID=488582 RepID=A0AAV2NWE9_9HYME